MINSLSYLDKKQKLQLILKLKSMFCLTIHFSITQNASWLVFCGVINQVFHKYFSSRKPALLSVGGGRRSQTVNVWVWATSSDILLHILQRDESLGEQRLEVWLQLSCYMNHGGFPRTWYSGNHCSGRASQLSTGAHILATGIPEVHRHLIYSSSRATPMHPCCPHSVASEWVDPGLMVSLFFGWFLGHILAGCQ